MRGRLVVLAGPSGVGKSSVVKRLRELYPQLWFSVSATTRAQRPGEMDGRDYYFVTPEQFERMITSGQLLEWAEIHGGTHRSGTPRLPVERQLETGRPALLELDLQGARAVQAAMPQALGVFIEPPSWEVLVSRLRRRATEADDVVTRRLGTARDELAARQEFDVVIVNDDLQRSAERLLDLMTGPDPRTADRPVEIQERCE